ncbi:MAG: hypothetical protein M1827_003827 [Pycnora praestabilis]|nr:MAG: hypothetical protein M1827_003827 [Pycnora praestabilis]
MKVLGIDDMWLACFVKRYPGTLSYTTSPHTAFAKTFFRTINEHLESDEIQVNVDKLTVYPASSQMNHSGTPSLRYPNHYGPLSWTLRLKHQKTTIVIYVEPTTTFAAIKSHLLEILNETSPDGRFGGSELPEDFNLISFGLPIDNNDLSKGFTGLEIPELVVEKKDGEKKVVGGKDSVLNTTPEGAGLNDGSILVFKFRHEVTDEGDAMNLDEDRWDNVAQLPSYDEEYGSQAETAVD